MGGVGELIIVHLDEGDDGLVHALHPDQRHLVIFREKLEGCGEPKHKYVYFCSFDYLVFTFCLSIVLLIRQIDKNASFMTFLIENDRM